MPKRPNRPSVTLGIVALMMAAPTESKNMAKIRGVRVVKDETPRYRVEGLKGLNGASFSTEAEARHEGEIFLIQKAMWDAKLGNPTSPYQAACAVHKAWKKIAPRIHG